MPTSPLASPRATIDLLERHGLYTKKSLGQHFLVDDNVVSRIVELADLRGDEVVLEVGPGIGTLTIALCAAAGAVVAVERDSALEPAIAESTAGCARFALVHADAVAVSPSQLAEAFGPPVALVANLPYQVAATVVLRFFQELPMMQQATVMVQTEVADRMAASPGTKDYGAYSVKLQLRARPAGRFQVARGCFLPPPRVDSTVIRLERVLAGHEESVLADAARVADAAFAQRRKTARNSLKATLGIGAEALEAVLSEAGIPEGARAETLMPEQFVTLAMAFRANNLL